MKSWFNKSLKEFDKLAKNLPHALLISGNKHIGKLEFTQIIVQKLTGFDISKDNLDELDREILIRKSYYPDLIYCKTELDTNKKSSNIISINQIREFIGFLTTTSKNLKIGIICYGDNLNINSANAILKTLEEPNPNTLIIILTHNIKLLPITLLSRCQKIHINADLSAIKWIKENINNNVEDKKIRQLLSKNNFVPQIVVDKINTKEDKLEDKIIYDLINVAINPNTINNINLDKIDLVIDNLHNLVTNIIKFKTIKQELNNSNYQYIIDNTKIKYLFLFFDDINYARYLTTTTINQKLVIDSLLIIWSHITRLNKYPEIFNHVKE